MKVWIQNPFDNLPTEGYRKQRYWLMAEAFVRAGHEVVYWTSDFSHAKKRARDCAGTGTQGFEVRMIPTLPYARNVSLARVRSHGAYAREWLRLALGQPSPQTLGSSNVPSLVVTSMPTLSAASAALRIGRAYGAKVVADVQDAWPETFERLSPRGLVGVARLLLAPLRRQARRIYREADLVTGVCDRYRELTGRSDYYRAYLGIESASVPARALSGLPNRDPARKVRLVYSGNLGVSYDLGTVVKAVEANDDFELDVAGFGGFSCTSPRVRFHGMLSESDLQALFARCDIGIVPMMDASWVGLPNKFFDYAKAGLRMVSSLDGECGAMIRRHGVGATYRAGDVASFVSAVRRVRAQDGAAFPALLAELDATRIYDAYVRRVEELCRG